MEEKEIKYDLDDIEIDLLVEGIWRQYGYDFRQYSRAHIKRRIMHYIGKSGYESVSLLQHDVLHHPQAFKALLPEFSINVTEMFRDPSFFVFLREEVVPYLKSFPRLKIWHAGCSSGEEVYSMAILLKEVGLYDRSIIYATDFNENILKKAEDGIYPVSAIKEYTKNYFKAGGKAAFSDYYTASYDSAIMAKQLKENISFAQHNLVIDGVFGEMDLIICRNVLIYFDRNLQKKVISLFHQSLSRTGILCLGTKETLSYADEYEQYEILSEPYRVYRRLRRI